MIVSRMPNLDPRNPRRHLLVSALSVVLFVIAFPVSTLLVPGGVMFGAVMVIPLTLVAWNQGERSGIRAAVIGIFYTELVYSTVHFFVRHNTATPFWAMASFIPPLIFLFIGIVVGRLSNTLRELRSTMAALKDSHAHLHAVLNAIPDLLFEVDRKGKFYEVPTPHTEHLLAAPSVFIGRTIVEMLPADAAAICMDALERASLNGEDKGAAYTLETESGLRWFELSISAVGDSRAEDAHFIVLVREITERKRAEIERRNLEEQFLQAQKMEAVGRLAGGIAHDFNNILMVILGYCDLIREVPEDRKEVLKSIGIVRDSAEKAASLTHQLLAFSRKQIIQPAVMDLNSLLGKSEELLRRVLGEDVGLIVRQSDRPCMVKADPGQLQQVIMNLAANARDAMPGGGKLTIEAHTVEVREGDIPERSDIAPGSYAMVSFSDTGAGMDAQTMARIFEPFFTTKELGKGTGLGLSIVYGIIEQAEGYITVTSQVGAGSTFHVYLPLTLDSGETRDLSKGRPQRGSETILLVEDEDAVRALILLNLTSRGYAVLEARNGAEAVKISQVHKGPIHLLLTDVVMPGMGGGKVAAHVRASRPDTRILLMTGYTSRFEELEQSLGEPLRILHKPFDMQELHMSVQKALEGTPGGAGSIRPGG
jgi:two-component system cell cycle sensor histidine kinase/response regulator CckA